MTQAQNMQKRYETPALTVFGSLEELTLRWSNPVAQDNFCPGAVGSQNINSGTFCIGGGAGGATGSETGSSESLTGDSVPQDVDLVNPELSTDLTGTGSGS